MSSTLVAIKFTAYIAIQLDLNWTIKDFSTNLIYDLDRVYMFRNTVRHNLRYGAIIQYPLYKDNIKSIVSNLLENSSEASNNTLSIHGIFIL